jgi:hypothetical protein
MPTTARQPNAGWRTHDGAQVKRIWIVEQEPVSNAECDAAGTCHGAGSNEYGAVSQQDHSCTTDP